MKYSPRDRCTEEELAITSIDNDTVFTDAVVSKVLPNDVKFVDGFHLFVEDAEKYVQPDDTLRLYGQGIGHVVRGVAVVKENGKIEVLRYKTPLESATEDCKRFEENDRKREEQAEKIRKQVDVDQPPKFKCKDLDAWKTWVKNNLEPYGRAVIVYAERWAVLMEKKMAEGATLKDIAKDTSHEADTDGITGFMYGAAIATLVGTWEHGEELRKWHNLDMQMGDEGEKANEEGGVLNPACLSISSY